MDTAESDRLAEARAGGSDWRRWGTYLSAWGTVREDYSADGDAWNFFPFEHSAARAYRWNEDGLAGWCDRDQIICLGLALWNGEDEILKERPFGLANMQGNHGEDVKDYWFYTDNLPTHAYASMVYKYPQAAFPYEDLRTVNGQRGQDQPEYKLLDALRDDWLANRYFDVSVEYAKASPEDLDQPGPRFGAHPRAAAPVVPQHLDLGPGWAAAYDHRDRRRQGTHLAP
jgi:hypothetical protein